MKVLTSALLVSVLVACGDQDSAPKATKVPTATPEAPTEPTPSGTVVETTTTNSAGSTVTASSMQLTAFQITAPVAPVIVSTPVLKWEASALKAIAALGLADEMVTYNLAVSLKKDCSNPTQSYVGITNTQQVLTALTAGDYYACVSAISGGNTKAAANSPVALHITLAPGSFEITNVSNTSSQTPTIAWGTAMGATSYTVGISRNADCSSPLQTYSTVLLAQQLTSLSQGNYYACVDAVNSVGSTASNKDYAFTIQYPSLPAFYVPYASQNTNRTKPASFNSDIASGLYFTCKIGTTTYNMYKFAGTVLVDAGPNTYGIYSSSYYIANLVSTYGCQSY